VVGSAFEFITPFDANLYGMLRQTHIILAYCLVAAHVLAVLLYTVTLRDGILNRMGRTWPATAYDPSRVSPSQRPADRQILDAQTDS
jgi:hypothetical protein